MNNINNYANDDSTRPIKDEAIQSIAVVGNSNSSLNFSMGKIIDSCDRVVRMNNFQLADKFAPYVGSKTDIFVYNFFTNVVVYPNSLRLCGVKQIWSAIPRSSYKPNWHNFIAKGIGPLSQFEVSFLSEREFFSLGPYKYEFGNLLRYLIFRGFGSNFMTRIGDKGFVPSSGLVAIHNALSMTPRELVITGFDFFSQNLSYYYSNETSPPQITHHHFQTEPRLLKRMLERRPDVKVRIAAPQNVREQLNGLSNLEFVLEDKNSG